MTGWTGAELGNGQVGDRIEFRRKCAGGIPVPQCNCDLEHQTDRQCVPFGISHSASLLLEEWPSYRPRFVEAPETGQTECLPGDWPPVLRAEDRPIHIELSKGREPVLGTAKV